MFSHLEAEKTSTPKHRSSSPQVFLVKHFLLKLCSNFTGEQPCRSMISIKLLCNFIEITLWHGCSPVCLLNAFRTPFPRNTCGWLFLKAGKSSLVIFAIKKNFMNFFAIFGDPELLSHGKLLKKVFMIYLIAIPCIFKENLNLASLHTYIWKWY